VCTRYMELQLKSTIMASDCQQSLKTIREDLHVRILEPGENPSMQLALFIFAVSMCKMLKLCHYVDLNISVDFKDRCLTRQHRHIKNTFAL